MTRTEQDFLLLLARRAIERKLGLDEPMPSIPELAGDEILVQHRGAFVTLHINGDLRGCIGMIEADKPLVELIPEVALKSAFADPRFPPLSESELKHIHIEISVLTRPEAVKDAHRITVGSDGLIIERGRYRGLLLPQVATDHKWSRETFLEETCWKAGLPHDAWKEPGTAIYSFQCEIFSETKR